MQLNVQFKITDKSKKKMKKISHHNSSNDLGLDHPPETLDERAPGTNWTFSSPYPGADSAGEAVHPHLETFTDIPLIYSLPDFAPHMKQHYRKLFTVSFLPGGVHPRSPLQPPPPNHQTTKPPRNYSLLKITWNTFTNKCSNRNKINHCFRLEVHCAVYCRFPWSKLFLIAPIFLTFIDITAIFSYRLEIVLSANIIVIEIKIVNNGKYMFR